MTDELIDSVVEKTGLERDKAEAAVNAVLDYFRESPDKVKEHVDVSKFDLKGLLGDAQTKLKPHIERGKDAAAQAQKKVAPVAAQGADKISEHAKKASGKLKEMSRRGENGASEAPAAAEGAVKEASTSES